MIDDHQFYAECAAQALAAMIAKSPFRDASDEGKESADPEIFEEIAKSADAYADAMVKERRKRYEESGMGSEILAANYPPAYIRNVLEELSRAEAKFPKWPTDPMHAKAIVEEEMGELTKAMLENMYEPKKGVDSDAIYAEAVQAAAMALRFLKNFPNYVARQSPQK